MDRGADEQAVGPVGDELVTVTVDLDALRERLKLTSREDAMNYLQRAGFVVTHWPGVFVGHKGAAVAWLQPNEVVRQKPLGA